ncbi:MAG: pyridoxal-phosphate dependent enzyme [Ktedonobacteraceae bacterium]|nr:pyridoxal-phosphate dependent enzyme [Ktedonobacteraceae bacterium]
MKLEAIAALSPGEGEKLLQQGGSTTLQPIYLTLQQTRRLIHLKMEGENPTGSMKDRTGYSLVRHFEEQGRLKKGATLIESTSGNLGVALAFIAKARGYRFTAVVDPKTTSENLARMHLLGAQIEMVTQPDICGGYLLSRLQRVQEYCQRSTEYLWTDQYGNAANPYIHYIQTAPEIYRQMQGRVDVVFVPVSTGGTLAGIGRFFREVSPMTQVIGVDACGSVIFGAPPAPRKLTGIGSSRPSSFLRPELYDTHLLIGDAEAFFLCRMLYAATGLMVGGSSGAVLVACIQYLATHPELRHVVCVCADRGQNYASTIFDDTWMAQYRFAELSQLLQDVSFEARQSNNPGGGVP